MIGLIRQWLTAVVLVTMLLSVAQTLVPEGTVRKITSFIGGLLLLLVMLQPLLRTDLGSLRIHAEDYAAAIEERQAELESAENEALAQGIAEPDSCIYIGQSSRAGTDGDSPGGDGARSRRHTAAGASLPGGDEVGGALRLAGRGTGDSGGEAGLEWTGNGKLREYEAYGTSTNS